MNQDEYKRCNEETNFSRLLCIVSVLSRGHLVDDLAFCHGLSAIWIPLGTIMMVVSLLGILGYMLFALRDLIRETEAKRLAEQQVSQFGE